MPRLRKYDLFRAGLESQYYNPNGFWKKNWQWVKIFGLSSRYHSTDFDLYSMTDARI